MSDAFIYEAIRTPRGKLKNGSLTAIKPTDLVVGLIDEIKDRNENLDPAAIDDIVLGCVSPVGEQGADIARTASIVAGLPETVAGVQINRFCASGLEATNIAAQKVGSARATTWCSPVAWSRCPACPWGPTSVRCSTTRSTATITTSRRRASVPT
ncbi:hypothetical protein MTP03_02370 [Tsukamurella sp. PLM1]|nr:hypothetical protein MTP03_02370 [Tsukamurella sp. PLM1]